MTLPKQFFCSELSRLENDQIFGTVKQTRIYLAVEYAPAWNKKALYSDLLSEEVRQFLSSVRARNPEIRLLLIRQEESKDRKPACFIAIPQEIQSAVYRWQLDTYRDLLDLNVTKLLVGEIYLPLETDPMFLVCNHGKHDKCCAKFGNPVVESAKAEVGNQLWECSHIGGCRFAANLICLPHGIAYGHLSPEDAITAIRQYKAGDIFLAKLRGRVNFSKPAQAAEYFVRRETGILGIDHLRLLQCNDSAPNFWNTTFALRESTTVFAVEHTSSRSESPRLLACSDAEPEFLWKSRLSELLRFELPNSHKS